VKPSHRYLNAVSPNDPAEMSERAGQRNYYSSGECCEHEVGMMKVH
jgi:hypothetical protein